MIRDRLADIVADAYQLAGRLDSPAFVLDFLYRVCRRLDPVQVPLDRINPAMIRGISRWLGISVAKLFAEDEDAAPAGSEKTREG
jgi:hypothetical protein